MVADQFTTLDEIQATFIDTARRFISYDPHTGSFIWKKRNRKYFATDSGYKIFHTSFAGQEAGNVSPKGYRRIEVAGVNIAAGRLAWIIYHGEVPPAEIDHINGIRDDNRICNLRLATRSQNIANREPCGLVKYKGVDYVKRRGRYRARVKLNGIENHLGYFDTAEQAHKAYKIASESLFGSYSYERSRGIE